MKNKRGVLVETDKGEKGVYYPNEPKVNDKFPVVMLTADLHPEMKDGLEVKKLFRAEQLKPIGFLN